MVCNFKYKIISFLFGLLLITSLLNAQNPLDIRIEIFEPYPVELDYYLGNADNLFITVTNTTGIDQEIYYHVRLIGNNGVDIQTLLTVKPVEPVLVPANRTLFYTGSEIERDFNFTFPQDIMIVTATQEQQDYIFFNRALPEGTYQLCVTARDFLTDIPLTFQCSDEFTVYYGDAPFIYMPYLEEVVPENDNARVTIAWEPPFTLAPPIGTFSYDLKMVDVTDDMFGDLERLFSDMGVVYVLDVKDIQEPIYNFDGPAEIVQLIPGHQYALRVRAKDNTGEFPMLTNSGYSEISTFWYGYNPADGIPDELEEQDNDCFENCYFTTNITTTPVGQVNANNPLKIGHFQITNLNLTSTVGSAVSGTGEIEIPFLNDVKVSVSFQNLGVNSSGRVYQGTVQAVVDQVYDPMNTNRGVAEEMNGFIRNGRIVNALAGGAAMGMPLGFVQNVAGYNFMLGFTSMTFTPQSANCQIMHNMQIPAFGEDGWISLAGTGVCLTPGGFGGEFLLHPVHDYRLPFQDDLTIRIKGHTSSDVDEIKQGSTFFEVDCNGIKSVGFKGEIDFPRNILVPDEPNGSIGDGQVTGSLFFYIERSMDLSQNVYAQLGAVDLPEEAGFHFLAEIDIEPFQVNGITGWGFEIDEAWLDCSDLANPPNIVWPQNYDDPNIQYQPGSQSMEMQNTWQGIYIRRAQLRSPDNFVGISGRKSIGVNHLIIDPKISANISVTNYIDRGESSVDGWSLSLDSLFISIVQNNLQSAGFSGELGMPISESGQYFRYTAMITDSDTNNNLNDPLSYIFSVSPSDELGFPFMGAKIYLSENTYVMGRFTPGNQNLTYFESYLEGGLGIKSDLFDSEDGATNLPLYLPVVEFNLTYHSKNGITNSHLGFAGCTDCGPTPSQPIDYDFSYGLQFSEESFVGFPLNIESAGFQGSTPSALKFNITPRVSLATGQGGIAAAVGISFNSELKTVNGEQKMRLQSMSVSKVALKQNAIYGITLEGELEFYNTKDQHNVGDKGARGELQVLLPALPGVKLAAEFGTSVSDPNAPFGTASNYGYWYLDGMMYFGDLAGVPVAPALGLYGLGGGVFVNMSRGAYSGMSQVEVDAMLAAAIQSGEDTRPTGTKPTRSFGSYGMKFAATLGTFPLPFALNMDVSLYAQFSQNHGINMLSIEGAAFAMSPLSARGQTPIWADAALTWEKLNDGESIFDGSFNLYVNLLGVITGRGQNNRMTGVHLHVETAQNGKWWFHAGSPKNRGGLRIGIPNLPTPTVRADGYFMMGHNLPDELPIPDQIAFLMNNPQEGSGKNRLDNKDKARQQERSMVEKIMAQNASGIAFGAELGVGIDINAWLLFATLEAYVGFDVNITRSESRTCYTGDGTIAPGINGWYALGQVYAGLEGNMGLQVKFAGKRHRLSLFRMGAAMMMRGGGPNPTWVEGRAGVYYSVLNGLKEGRATFDVTIGEKCVPAMGDPFGDLEIIYETIPDNGDTGVSTFESPTATFILPVGIPFDLPTYDANGEPYTMTVELELNKNTVKKEDDNAQVPVETLRWSSDGSSVSVKLLDKLQERTWYIAEFRVIAWEHKTIANFSGGSLSYSQVKERLKDENNLNWKEERNVRFRTGADPYPIPDEVVSKTVPIRRQRYFMRDEMAIPTFELHFTHNIKEGYFPDSNDDFDYDYYIRIEDLEGGDPIIRSVSNTMVVERILNVIPVLNPATIYSVQLVRKRTRKTGRGLPAFTSGGPSAALLPSGLLSLSDKITTQINHNKQELSLSDTLNRQATIDPGQRQEAGESIIYQYFFRTSKYNTMTEKLDAITVRHETYAGYQAGYTGVGWDGLYIVLEGDEKFDVFDIRGDRKDGVTIVAPRLDVFAQEPTTSLISFGITGERLLFNKIRAHISPTLSHYDALPGSFSIRHTAPTGYQDRVYTYNSKPAETVQYHLPSRNNNIKADLNLNITGYRGPLSDDNIYGTSGSSNTGTLLPSSGLTPLGYGFSSPQVNVVNEVLRIDYNLFGMAREDALAVRNWALAILSETRTVVFNPIVPTHSTTYSVQLKWGNHFDIYHPAFRNSIMDSQQSNEFLRSNNRGNYTIKFNSNKQYAGFHIPSGTTKNFTITY